MRYIKNFNSFWCKKAGKNYIVMMLLALLLLLTSCMVSAASVNEVAKLTASDAAEDDYFGDAVSVDGNTIVVGAYGDDDGGSRSGSAYVFTRSGTTWTEQQKLTASDAAEDDLFGDAVSVDGDTIVVGAYGDDDGGSDSGSAYVFTRSGTIWTEQQKLTALDAAEGDWFGWSVSVDGDTIVVGAVGNDEFSGSAYVFTRSGTIWTEQQKLTASDAAVHDTFGSAILVDGDTIVIGAYGDEDGGFYSGSAYVFTRSGTTWTEQQKLTASDAAAKDLFGSAVSVDGDTIVVGAQGNDDGGSRSGSAYVFTRSGTTWTEQQKLTASDAAEGDLFGSVVSVDGDTIVIGADFDDDDGSRSGSAYVFTRSSTIWTEQQKLTASDAAEGDFFGRSISVDGDTIVVGADGDDDGGSRSGSTYVFASLVTVVDIDIKPGSDSNSFNNNGYGVIPVAILGSQYLDVTEIDVGSVALEGMAVRAVGKSNKLLAHYEDVNGDAILDLVVQIEDTDGTFEVGDSTATLTGNLLDGTPIEGQDSIRIVP